MRLLSLSLFLAVSSCLSAQTNLPPLTRAPKAIALAERMLSANRVQDDLIGTVIVGTIRLGSKGDPLPIKVYTQGTSRSRTEISQSAGTSIKIHKDGFASFQPAVGKVVRLNPINTIGGGINVMPMLSLVREYASEHLQLEDIGMKSLGNVSVHQMAVSWSDALGLDDQTEFLKRTRTVYSVDPVTFRILQLDYDRCAERDTNVIVHYKIVYSNYRSFGDALLPSTVTTYTNEAVSSVLEISDFTSGVTNDPSLFELSGVTK
jgi:hypothetical protein